MNKQQLRTWPHNGQPSALHQMKERQTFANGNHSSDCLRCGCHFNAFADTRAPVYCSPTPQWRAANPDDDGALGVLPDGQRAGDYGRPLRVVTP